MISAQLRQGFAHNDDDIDEYNRKLQLNPAQQLTIVRANDGVT